MRRVPYRACWRASCGRSGRGGRDRAAQLRPVRHRRDARRVRAERSRRSRASRRRAPPEPRAARSARASARTRASREAIDDADDILVAPFAGIVGRLGQLLGAPRRPALLALLVYGFGPVLPRPLRRGALDRAGGRAARLRRAGRLRARRRGGADPGGRRDAGAVARRRRGPRAHGRRRRRRRHRAPDTYAALVELASPVRATPARASRALGALRARVHAAGGTVIGAGIHPDGAFGDVVHSTSRATPRSASSCAGSRAHADLRAPRARRHARRRGRDPCLQRAARAPAAAAGAGRQLAVLVRPRLGAGHRARPALPRLSARGDPARVPSYDDYAETRRGGRRGRRAARLHLPLVGHPPAPAPRHGRGARDGQPVGAVVGGRRWPRWCMAGARRGAGARGTPGCRARC